MSYDPLPPDLESLEGDLVGLRREPLAELRPRVLRAVDRELLRDWPGERWRFAAAVALVAALSLNLSLSASQATDFGFHLRPPAQPTAATVQQIRELAPELSEREAWRQAVLLQGASSMVCLPEVPRHMNLERQKNILKDLLP